MLALVAGEGGREGEGGVHGANHVADAYPGTNDLTAEVSWYTEEAGQAEEVEFVAGLVGVGAALAVAGEGAQDQARVGRVQRVEAEAKVVEDAGAVALDDRVGGAD